MQAPARLREHVALAPLTSLGTGGSARWFLDVHSEAELRQALQWAAQAGIATQVLGGGSNLVVRDGNLDGLVIQIGLRGVANQQSSAHGVVRVTAAAGEPWDTFVASTCDAGLAGLECLSGIPGLVGATPIQNVGAYGQEVSQTIASVRCLERSTSRVYEFSASDCDFAYRSSRFKHQDAGRFVVTSVSFDLSLGGSPCVRYTELERALETAGHPSPSLNAVRSKVLELRRAKSMLLDPNDPNGRSCGSFFTNAIMSEAEFAELERRCGERTPPTFPAQPGFVKVPAAWLIEQAGFAKGTRDGNVGLSTVHTLCVVAHAGATSAEIIAFARKLRDGVRARFGVELVPEPVFLGTSW